MKTYRGIARNVSHQQKQRLSGFCQLSYAKTEESLSFKLEQVDQVGNIGGHCQVHFTAKRVKEILADGDEVEVVGRVRGDGTVAPKRITNLATQATLAKPFPLPPWWAFWHGLPVMVVGLIVILFLRSASPPSRPYEAVRRPGAEHPPQFTRVHLAAERAVREEQTVERRLCDLGYLPCPLLPGTPLVSPAELRQAIQRFQAVHGLRPDGIVGPKTQQKLFSAEALAAPQRDRY